MTTKTKKDEKTQGVETSEKKAAAVAKNEKPNLAEINEQKKLLEQKLESYECFNLKVGKLSKLEKHKAKIKEFSEAVTNSEFPDQKPPKLTLEVGYNLSYEITQTEWVQLLANFMLEKMAIKTKEFEKEIREFELN